MYVFREQHNTHPLHITLVLTTQTSSSTPYYESYITITQTTKSTLLKTKLIYPQNIFFLSLKDEIGNDVRTKEH